MEETPKNILEFCEVVIGYDSNTGRKELIAPFDLASAKAKLIGVLGVNGCGKSTLLRSLAGLQPLLHGKILIHGKDVAQCAAQELSKIVSVVLTDRGFSKNLSVYELVALGRQPYTNWFGKLSIEDHKVIDQAFETTSLTDLANTKCHALSDGQLQRALIARALAQNTPVVVLDEPTTHLDLHHKAAVLLLLKETAKKKTVIFSCHDIEMALHTCDELLIFNDSKLHHGTPDELVHNGLLGRLFSSRHIGFDEKTRRYFLNH
ncbi:MAG: ABC transporter ATP-binding protein [Leeuwenhoekiella sp.]